MKICYDPVKNQLNQAKHGVSFEEAAYCDWTQLYVVQDRRQEYGEARLIGYVPLKGRLDIVVFTWRDDTMRIISLRKANRREERQYEQTKKTIH